MSHTDIDILSLVVIWFDCACAAFLVWRAVAKKATLWGAARGIYGWVALLSLYHCSIYAASLFVAEPNHLIYGCLHPFVVLFMLNPLLIAIIHWRGGKLWT